MSHRNFTAPEFAAQISAKTGQFVLIIQTDGTDVTSADYDAIKGIDLDAKLELYKNDLVFITFDDEADACHAFTLLSGEWDPQSKFHLIANLGRPGKRTKTFLAFKGQQPEIRLAA